MGLEDPKTQALDLEFAKLHTRLMKMVNHTILYLSMKIHKSPSLKTYRGLGDAQKPGYFLNHSSLHNKLHYSPLRCTHKNTKLKMTK